MKTFTQLYKVAPVISALGIFLGLLLCSGSPARSDSPGSKWGLWSQGTALRGANVYQQDESRSDKGGDFGPNLVLDDLQNLADAGANYVNFSIPGTYHVKTNTQWPQMIAHLDNMVQWAKEAGLYVVISARTGPGRGEGDITEDGLMNKTVYNNASQQKAWVSMWQQIAKRYGSQGHVVGLDLMVEPHDVSRAKWRSFAQKMIDGIRSVDSQIPILVSPGDWGGADSLDGWNPLRGNNLVYTVHQYEPFTYTHEESASYSPSDLSDQFATMKQWMAEHPGQPLAVNEFGVKKHKKGADRFLVQELQLLEQLGANHAAWLWEVSDTDAPSFAPQFDFKQNAKQLAAFKNNWRKNAVRPGQ